MGKQALILTTTHEFLGKFEQENVKILQHMGYTVHYASNMKEPRYVKDWERIKKMGVLAHHIEIARSPFLFRENIKALRQLLRLIRVYNIQILHCHTPVGGVLGRMAGRLYRGGTFVVIYTAHGFHFYSGAPLLNWLAYYPVERWLARYTDILIVINQEDYENARHFRLKKGGRLCRIPGVGLDEKAYAPLSRGERLRLRRKLGIGEEVFFLVSVGELNENKNHQVVLKALAKQKGSRQGRKIRYAICGDGFFRDRIQEQIHSLGLADQVTLYGYCPKIAEILGCADASVFPSRREGLGMAGLESLAMGVPVLAADNRGTREYMRNGRNGFICPYDDADGFARGILRLMGMGEQEKKRMRRECANTVRPFRKSKVRARMRSVYAYADRKARGRW